MNATDIAFVEIAQSALVRGGHEQSVAQLIALETVADHLTQQSKRLRESAQYAEGKTYHREIEHANELLSRANSIMSQAAKLREKSQ